MKQRNWINWVFLVAIIGGTIGMNVACELPANSSREAKAAPAIDFGNGVYYFDLSEDHRDVSFGKGLSGLIAANPEREIATVTPDSSGGHDEVQGFYVVMRERGKKTDE